MEGPIRVLVVDDHFVVRKGVLALLGEAMDIVVAGEASDGPQAIAEARYLAPHVVLMDLRLPGIDGVEATRIILSERPNTGIIVLTGTDVEEQVVAAIEAGALGYLAKTSPREDFLEAIRHVARGEAWLPPRVTTRLLAHLKPRPTGSREAEPLTRRESQVLKRLAQGWSNGRIAGELSISEVTVRTHVSRVLDKLGVSNRVEAVLHALRTGLVSPEP